MEAKKSKKKAVKKRTKVDRASAKIRSDLIEQLLAQNKCASFYTSLVDDYIYYWKIKQDLAKDIKKRGVIVDSMSGNGFSVTKSNDSIANLNKVTATMLKILSDLNLREPQKVTGDPNDYL